MPLLAAVRPNGEVPIEAFEDAGGTRAVMKQLEPLLHGEALTVTGRTVGENLAGVTVTDPEVIRPPERALGHRPTIVLIHGSLAPDGGIVKLAVADDRRLDFACPAVVFDSPAQALAAVRAGRVSAGQVVVLRGQGPTGSPGMGMASQLVFALDGAGLTGQVAVVTDGQLSGLVNKGKSSLLMGIAGLVRRRGGVQIFGATAPNGDVGWAARHGLTLVPERRQLYPGLSAADNIVLGCYCWTSSLRKARASRQFGLASSSAPPSSRPFSAPWNRRSPATPTCPARRSR